MVLGVQGSAAQSSDVHVNFSRTNHYIFTQHPADGSEWLCVVVNTREINCAHMSQYYVDNLEYVKNELNTYERIQAKYD